MGRGGGGGSSHSSSHHSSSHSHSGGSRSSGSSYRSSSRSSYSHHSRSGSNYRSGNGSYTSSGSTNAGNGCGTLIVKIFCFFLFLPFIVALLAMFGMMKGIKVDSMFKIERSTIQREALPSSKCTKYDGWYRDDWGDWIDEAGEEQAVIEGLEYFYEKTGVQPYLWIMGEDGKQYKSEGSVEELADATYKEMFGKDEGHMIVIFREYPNASSNYIVTCTPGYDAETQVMDEQAREVLLSCIDYYYSDDDLNEGNFFKTSFVQAADRIMTKQLSKDQMYMIIGIVLILAVALIVIFDIRKKRKVAVAKQKAQQARAEADKVQVEFNQQKYKDQLETQYVAVTCPNCGAAGNKIRKTTVGYCQYCGTAMKVDQDGNVVITSGDGTAET